MVRLALVEGGNLSETLSLQLSYDPNEKVRAAVIRAYTTLPSDRYEALLKDPSPEVRKALTYSQRTSHYRVKLAHDPDLEVVQLLFQDGQGISEEIEAVLFMRDVDFRKALLTASWVSRYFLQKAAKKEPSEKLRELAAAQLAKRDK